MSDNYEEDEDIDDTEDEDAEQSELASEFETLCADVHEQIEAKMKVARKAVKEAVAIAEKHGVPFRADVSPLGNSYLPQSFHESKFAELDQEVVCEIADVWGDYLFECGGWQHSAVC
jgi:hypothetical protein